MKNHRYFYPKNAELYVEWGVTRLIGFGPYFKWYVDGDWLLVICMPFFQLWVAYKKVRKP